MRRSNRLNVVRIDAQGAPGKHSHEQLLPQDELNVGAGEDEIEVEQHDHEDHNISDGEPKKRGETLLAHVWNLPAEERIVVKCNKFGQPIGKEGGLLGQFLGTVARNGGYCPLNLKDWRLVKRNGGDRTIIDLVKTKFLYPHSCEKWILKSVGRDWRQYKATLKKALFNVKKKKSVLYRRCPEDVDEDQWIGLVKQWKSRKGKTQSERNKRSVSKKKRTHTAGTKSYARWAEDMRQADPEKKQPHRAQVYLMTHKQKGEQKDEHVEKLEEIIEGQPELAENNNGKVAWEGDALHSVLGEEYPGHVHGMGMLPVPSQAYGQKSHLLKDINTTTVEVETPMEITMLEEIRKMKEQIKNQGQIIENLQKQACTANAEQRECEAIYGDNFQPHVVTSKRKRVECEVPTINGSKGQHGETSRCNMKRSKEQATKNMIPQRPKRPHPSAMAVGTIVVLRSAKYPNKEHVAYATFLSCDPNELVGGVAVGKQFSKVRVNHPMDESEELVRPWGGLKTLGDAKGKSIAWPSTFVEKVNG